MKNSVMLFVAFAAIVSFAFINPIHKARPINVVIDAAHGGKDAGGNHDDITEKEIVAQFASKIKKLNDDKNIVLHFTRESDNFVELGARTTFINKIKPDLVLSLHVNFSPNKVKSGVGIYIAKESMHSQESSNFAQRLAEKLKANHSLNSTIEKATYFMLKNTDAPAMVLELGFLTNDQDRKYLVDDNEQTRIANTILEFIAETN